MQRETRRLAAIVAIDVVGFSRLVGQDEEGTLAALSALRSKFIDPTIARFDGRIVKTMGDGLLLEFPSVVEASRCAIAVQDGMATRERDVPEERRLTLRIGINLGDVVVDGEDILGDGVNVAARLEQIADPGGISLSGAVYEQVKDRLDVGFEDRGHQELKNIAHPVQVFSIKLADGGMADQSSSGDAALEQDIRYCTASDGVQIAYATVGNGPPLVKTANWLNHLEFDWESPIWSKLLHELACNNTLVRYDERGNGLSDWDAEDLSFEAFVTDLETVVDEIGLERFALFGVSQGCSVSIAYAAKHPDKVSRMVLYGGYAQGALTRQSEEQAQQQAALAELIRVGWGQGQPGLPAGLHIAIHSRRHARAVQMVQRAATDRGVAGERDPSRQHHRPYRRSPPAFRSRRADLDPALPGRRPGSLRTGPVARQVDSRRPLRALGGQQPFDARARAGLAQVPFRSQPLPRRRDGWSLRR